MGRDVVLDHHERVSKVARDRGQDIDGEYQITKDHAEKLLFYVSGVFTALFVLDVAPSTYSPTKGRWPARAA